MVTLRSGEMWCIGGKSARFTALDSLDCSVPLESPHAPLDQLCESERERATTTGFCWQRRPALSLPEKRWGHDSALLRDNVLVVGGTVGETRSPTCLLADTQSGPIPRWLPTASLSGGRAGMVVVPFDGASACWSFGGRSDTGAPVDIVEFFDSRAQTSRWQRASPLRCHGASSAS